MEGGDAEGENLASLKVWGDSAFLLQLLEPVAEGPVRAHRVSREDKLYSFIQKSEVRESKGTDNCGARFRGGRRTRKKRSREKEELSVKTKTTGGEKKIPAFGEEQSRSSNVWRGKRGGRLGAGKTCRVSGGGKEREVF